VSVAFFEIRYRLNGRPVDDPFEKIKVAAERAGAELLRFEKHVWPRVIPVLEAGIRQQYEEEGGGPHRGAWAALSATYLAWKERHGFSSRIGQRTGNLMAALTQSDSPFARRDYDSERLDFGTVGINYASFVQEGTRYAPDRPPLDFHDDTEQDLRAALVAGIREAMQPLEGL
jgi:hypothetical protein